jgi:glucosyl-dolichyl phosphate glucuronosyltransferase
MTETTEVSVVICTHNRARHLGNAIASVLAQRADHPGTEILVVDNRSTDETADVVARYAPDKVRHVFEPEIGLCNARNRGWREASGRYVAYLDDDAVAEPGWLEAVAEAFDRSPRPGVVGGRVEPIWEETPPTWLSDELALGLTIVDWSAEPRAIPDVRIEWLVGTNMALPREVLERVGGFHPALDRSGSNMLSSGDVFLQKKVMALGLPCFYHPRMAVRHRVEGARLRQEWFRRRYLWQGISDARMEQIEAAPSAARRVGIAARHAARLIASPDRLLWLVVPTSDARRFTAKCMGLIELGHIAGSLGAAGR